MRVNLLPKDQRPLKQSQVRWGFLVGLAGVLLLGATLLFSWIEINRVTSLHTSVLEAQNRDLLLQRQVQGVQTLRKEVADLEATEKSYGGLFAPRSETINLIPKLTAHPFDNLWVEASFWKGDQVELVGYTQNMTSLSQYLNYLNERSEQALLQTVHPYEETGFFVFSIQLKGVAGNDSAQLN